MSINRKYEVNSSAFDKITEESAYWIGFLMADGCIIVDKRSDSKKVCVVLQKNDVGHLVSFKKFLQSEQIIRFEDKVINGWNSQGMARLNICCTELANKLEKYGIIPRKSMIEEVRLLENNKNFWRGMIDGDGWVLIENRFRRLANGSRKEFRQPVIGLCGSYRMMEQFSCFVKNYVPDFCYKIRRNNSIWRLSINGIPAVKVIKGLYESCSIALRRKQLVADEIMKMYENKSLDKKVWKIVDPQGLPHTFTNQTEFAETHRLCRGNLSSLLLGTRKSCNGWTLPKVA